jgi:hypothetical protein
VASAEDGGEGEADAAAVSSDEEYHDAVESNPVEQQPASQVLCPIMFLVQHASLLPCEHVKGKVPKRTGKARKLLST